MVFDPFNTPAYPNIVPPGGPLIPGVRSAFGSGPINLYGTPTSTIDVSQLFTAAPSPPALLNAPAPSATVSRDQLNNNVQNLMVNSQESGDDFLAQVRDAGGGFFRGAFNFLDLPNRYLSRPAFELWNEPKVVFEKLAEANGDIGKAYDLINERFHEREDIPGIVKFGAEVAFDPFTYLTAGTTKAAAIGISKIPVLGSALRSTPGVEKTAKAVIGGMEKYESVVNTAFKSVGETWYKPAAGFAEHQRDQGIIANFIPLQEAKRNAENLLRPVFGPDLTRTIVNTVPDEYTGLNVSKVTGFANVSFKKLIGKELGLPGELRVPKFRAVTTSFAYNHAYETARLAFTRRGINFAEGADKNLTYSVIRELVDADPKTLEKESQLVVRDILLRPDPINLTEIRNLAKTVGGTRQNIGIAHVPDANRLVYNFNLGLLPRDLVVDGLAQITGSNIRDDVVRKTLGNYLDVQGHKSQRFVSLLEGKRPEAIVNQIADRAKRIQSKEFTTGIQLARMQQTIWDQTLDKFDDHYKAIWTQGIQKQLVSPVSRMYLQFSGFIAGNAIESQVRSVLGGGGFLLPMDSMRFRMEFGMYPSVPVELLRKESASYQSLIMRDMNTGGTKAPLDYIAAPGDFIVKASNHLDLGVRRHFWKTITGQEYDRELRNGGFGGRTTEKEYLSAVSFQNLVNDPKLQGMPRELLQDFASALGRTVPQGEDYVEGAINLIRSKNINRAKLASVIDEFPSLDLTARLEWSDGIMNGGIKSSADISALRDEVVKKQKAMFELAPDVMREKFEGMAKYFGNPVNFKEPSSMFRGYGELQNVMRQFAGIPDVIRDAEYIAVNRARETGKEKAIGRIHSEYLARIEKALSGAEPAIEKSLQQFSVYAKQHGVETEAIPLMNSLRAEVQLIKGSWEEDKLWQADFWKTKPDRKAKETWDEYFQTREELWRDYYAKHLQVQNQNVIANQNFQVRTIAVQEERARLKAAIPGTTSAGISLSEEVYIKPVENAISESFTDLYSAALTRRQVTGGEIDKPITFGGIVSDKYRSVSDDADATKVFANPWLASADVEAKIGSLTPETHAQYVDQLAKKLHADSFHEINTKMFRDDDANFFASLKEYLERVPESDSAFVKIKERLQAIPYADFKKFTDHSFSVADNAKKVRDAETDRLLSEIAQRQAPGISTANQGRTSELIVGGNNESVGRSINEEVSSRIPGEQIKFGEDLSGSTEIGPRRNAPTNSYTPNANDPYLSDATPILRQYFNETDEIGRRLETSAVAAIKQPVITDEQISVFENFAKNANAKYQSLDQIGKKILNDALRNSSVRAKERYNQSFTNYENQNSVDYMMKHLFPFWTYESSKWPWLVRQGLTKPAVGTTYASYIENTDDGYISMGDESGYHINLTRGTLFGGLHTGAAKEYPLKHTEGIAGALESLEATLGKFGFYMGPHVSIPSSIIRGEAGNALPEPLATVVNTARAVDAPGSEEVQNLLPDSFRDYYTNQIIAAKGLEPEKIRNRALANPDSEEASVLDAAQRQSSMVAVVLGQTGMLRYRVPEYTEFTEKRMAAIENITGISIEQQRELKQQGISLSQVVQMSPAQRSELNSLPGTAEFSQLTTPLLNKQAAKIRNDQREFWDAVKKERVRVSEEQQIDDQRFQGKVISGTEWRKRYQERSNAISQTVETLKKSDAYRNVPVSKEEQALYRKRFNLPLYMTDPMDNVLQEYYSVRPIEDAVTGEINWPTFFQERDVILSKYGPEMKASILQHISRNDTPQVQNFKAAMEQLRPYFSLKEKIIEQYPQLAQAASIAETLGKEDPIKASQFREHSNELKVLNRLVGQLQKQIRLQYPQVDSALVKYFGAIPQEYQELKSIQSKSSPSIRSVFAR